MDGGLEYCAGGGDQNHHQEKEMQEGKVVIWGGLTNSWEEKQKGKEEEREKERYTQLNAEFQRIARRERKSYVNNAKKLRKTIEWERIEISSR